MKRNHYLILGVPRDVTAEGIQRAFRDLAKRHHPDATGSEDAARFREICEAYEVLSDPGRRLSYNHELDREKQPAFRPKGGWPEPDPIAPFVDRSQPASRNAFQRPDFPEPGNTGFDPPPSQIMELEVLLSPGEAWRGGRLPLRVPVERVCGACGGAGRQWAFVCPECLGAGRSAGEIALVLTIRPGVRSGAVIDAPLDGFDVPGAVLRVRLRVA